MTCSEKSQFGLSFYQKKSQCAILYQPIHVNIVRFVFISYMCNFLHFQNILQ